VHSAALVNLPSYQTTVYLAIEATGLEEEDIYVRVGRMNLTEEVVLGGGDVYRPKGAMRDITLVWPPGDIFSNCWQVQCDYTECTDEICPLANPTSSPSPSTSPVLSPHANTRAPSCRYLNALADNNTWRPPGSYKALHSNPERVVGISARSQPSM
jgi:hypothetical protein